MPFERGIIQFSNRYMNQNSLNVESSEKEFDFCDCDKMKKKIHVDYHSACLFCVYSMIIFKNANLTTLGQHSFWNANEPKNPKKLNPILQINNHLKK